MTKEEIFELCAQLRKVFDIVRLVDASVTTQYEWDDSLCLHAQPYACYEVWTKQHRCENCISARVLAEKNRLTKFEFIGDEVYNVVASYVEVDGVPYVLEIVLHITDETMFSGVGKNDFIEIINRLNKNLYTDVLTGTYNRKYYEEHLRGLGHSVDAVAMLDIDDFKNVNDHYGHTAGDQALRAIGSAVTGCLRANDVLTRYGGDEFVLVFRDLPQAQFAQTLEQICLQIRTLVLPDYPDLHLTVSVGGVYRHGSVPDLVAMADRLMYRAKQTKDCIQVTG